MTKALKPVAGEARHYIRIKEQILAEIAEGKLQPGDRVSSESELVAAFGVSRMTANRALRELMFEGVSSDPPGSEPSCRQSTSTSICFRSAT